MEAEVIKSFLPDLVPAISDIVQPVSDKCLAEGLISDSVYKRILESGGTSEDKARTLILAVKTSTETDGRCLEILLNILKQHLPYRIRDKLLSKIRNKIAERAIADAEVPNCTPQIGELQKSKVSNERTGEKRPHGSGQSQEKLGI